MQRNASSVGVGAVPGAGVPVRGESRARQARGESVTAIARHIGIGRSTLYRALPEDQDAVAEPVS
ncbi:helix-turn-helix domain-containing protein [Micromonospora sp. DT47]|uniref:helix-turn-helix domain-containing protein n=1 Tax=Micromonospora sp. DT47 TaxID=3393431 RepID=UPI003CEAF8AA